MEKCIQTFEAFGESGRKYELHIYQDFIDVGTRDNPHTTAPGMKRLLLRNGYTVNRLDQGKYQVVQTGEILRSNSPDAP